MSTSEAHTALDEAIEKAGSSKALAAAIGVTAQALSQWRQVPPLRVLDVERATGVPRHRLRPDLYPDEGQRGTIAAGDAA